MTAQKVMNFISEAKTECDSFLSKLKNHDSKKKILNVDFKDFLVGSKLGLEMCPEFFCLEKYEQAIINFEAIENKMLDDIKFEVGNNSLNKNFKLDKRRIKLLNKVKGIRCSLNLVYNFMLNQLGESKDETVLS